MFARTLRSPLAAMRYGPRQRTYLTRVMWTLRGGTRRAHTPMTSTLLLSRQMYLCRGGLRLQANMVEINTLQANSASVLAELTLSRPTRIS